MLKHIFIIVLLLQNIHADYLYKMAIRKIDLAKGLKNEKNLVLHAVQERGLALEYASKKLQNDKDIVLAAVKENEIALKYASKRFQDDKDIVLAVVKENGSALKYVNKRFQDDKDIVLAAVKENEIALEYASKRFQDDKDIVLAVVKENGDALYYASKKLQNDKDIVLAAVKQSGDALRNASKKLQNDKDIVLAAVKQSGDALEYANKRFQDDKDIVFSAVKEIDFSTVKEDNERVHYGSRTESLKYASKRLQDDKDFILSVVKKYGHALRYTSKRLQDDKDIVLAAVKENSELHYDFTGSVLYSASKRLQDDKDIVLAAVKDYGRELNYASKRLQDDKDIVLAAVKKDGYALKYASKRLQAFIKNELPCFNSWSNLKLYIKEKTDRNPFQNNGENELSKKNKIPIVVYTAISPNKCYGVYKDMNKYLGQIMPAILKDKNTLRVVYLGGPKGSWYEDEVLNLWKHYDINATPNIFIDTDKTKIMKIMNKNTIHMSLEELTFSFNDKPLEKESDIKLNWEENLNKAVGTSKKENKLLLLLFHNDNIAMNKKIKGVFSNQKIQKYIKEKYILANININEGKHKDKIKYFKIKETPTFIRYNFNTNTYGTYEGFIDLETAATMFKDK